MRGDKQAAPADLLREALDELYRDNHHWSTRPCETCAAITAATGISFGCDKMAGRAALAGEREPSGEATTAKVTNVAGGVETGWLVEIDRGNGPEWLCFDGLGREDWTKDSIKATRFARRQDADGCAAIYEDVDVRVTEHQWGT